MCVSQPLSQSNGFVQPSVAVLLPLNDPANWSESPITHAHTLSLSDILHTTCTHNLHTEYIGDLESLSRSLSDN